MPDSQRLGIPYTYSYGPLDVPGAIAVILASTGCAGTPRAPTKLGTGVMRSFSVSWRKQLGLL